MNSHPRSVRPSPKVTPVSGACLFGHFGSRASRFARPLRLPAPCISGFLPPMPPPRPPKRLEENPIEEQDASNHRIEPTRACVVGSLRSKRVVPARLILNVGKTHERKN